LRPPLRAGPAGAAPQRRARLLGRRPAPGNPAFRAFAHGPFGLVAATLGLPFSPVRRNGPRGPIFFRERRFVSQRKVSLTKTYDKERQLTQEIAPRVEHDLPGVEVLAVELANPDRFVVYVDHPEGVDHALCVRVTDLLRDYLREYTVDVSSPGIERPLRKPAHFARIVGQKVSLRTAEPVSG